MTTDTVSLAHSHREAMAHGEHSAKTDVSQCHLAHGQSYAEILFPCKFYYFEPKLYTLT